MAAIVANRTEVGWEKIGGSVVSCPDDPRARLMFYVKCMCDVLDLDDPYIQRLTDYENYILSFPELNNLMRLCLLLCPDELEGKCIFYDPVACGEKMYQFVAISAVQHRLLVTPELILGNQVKHVKKIMFYKREFLEVYYVRAHRDLKAVIDKMGLELKAHIRAFEQQRLQQQQQLLAITNQRQEYLKVVTPSRRVSPTTAYANNIERYFE